MKFIPHKYQEYAISFIEEHPMSILLLDMGLGLLARPYARYAPSCA